PPFPLSITPSSSLLPSHLPTTCTTPPSFLLPSSVEAAKIQVQLYVSSIDAVNEASMDFTVGILLHLRWTDSRYGEFSKKMFDKNGFSMMDFDSENIKNVWVPDIFFPNEKKGYFHDIMSKNQMMRLYRGGEILYISRVTVTLSCPMDLLHYPFDKQTCHLLIMSFSYSDQDVVFTWMNASEPFVTGGELEAMPVKLADEVVLPQFEVKGVEPTYCNIQYHQKMGNHSCLQADFHMERNIGFYIVQMYIPSMLIVMLSWISFWLTVNSVPGRISLGLLTVLTMTTQSSSVNASLPRVSYTKAIDVWMSTCLVFVFAALLEFAVVNVLSRKDSIRGFSLKHVFTVPKELLGGNDVAEVTVPLDGFNNPPKKRRFMERGIVYAMYVDIAARIFFPLCFIIFIVIYWLYYVNAS
ncbi:glycine receptor subunit alpha-2, partial [Aplysia californica]|uniref:Glycine receptor subunit alpha-2 n=1 Tax=Aplysia californica TaxID=6500 RepID=A0ABM0ZUE0_APLCA